MIMNSDLRLKEIKVKEENSIPFISNLLVAYWEKRDKNVIILGLNVFICLYAVDTRCHLKFVQYTKSRILEELDLQW